MIRGDSDSTFETAYFVMRPEKQGAAYTSDGDMVEEAMRLVDGMFSGKEGERGDKKKDFREIRRRIALCIAAFVSGAGLTGLILAALNII